MALDWEPVRNEVVGRVLAMRVLADRFAAPQYTPPPGTDDAPAINPDEFGVAEADNWLMTQHARQLFDAYQGALNGNQDPTDGTGSEAYWDLEALAPVTCEEYACYDFVFQALPAELRPTGALRKLLDLVEAVSCLTDGGALTIDQAACVAETTPAYMRFLVFKGDSRLRRALDPETGQARIEFESFMDWLRENRRHRWAPLALAGSDSRRATPEAVVEELIHARGFTYHPRCKPDNKSMACLLSGQGQVVAVEKRRTPKMWFPARQPVRFEGLDTGFSDSDSISLGPGADYGRHSGLKKYEELRTESLAWVRPKILADLDPILKTLETL